jgi:hypothetical protein
MTDFFNHTMQSQHCDNGNTRVGVIASKAPDAMPYIKR